MTAGKYFFLRSSDFRISPFELENIAVEHPAVMEAAVVPSPDPVRHAVPKAFIALAPGYPPSGSRRKKNCGRPKKRRGRAAAPRAVFWPT